MRGPDGADARVDRARAAIGARSFVGARAWAVLVVSSTVAALYARTLGYGLVFDDLSLLGPHGPLHVGNTWLAYRPMRYASYAVDYWIGGGRTWVYHATNVALQLAASLLILSIARRLALGWLAATCAACAFAMHPLGVEAVAYVAGRRDVLALALGLAALRAWLQPGWAWPAVALLAAAAGAKESGLVLVGVLAAASLCRLSRASLRPLALAGAAAAALVAAYGAATQLGEGLARWTPLAQARLAVHYASGLALARDYAVDYPELAAPYAATAWAGWALAVALLAALAACLRWCLVFARRRVTPSTETSRRTAFLCTWLVLAVAATIGLAGFHEPGADRHAYPLLPPTALLLASLTSAAWARRQGSRLGWMHAAGGAAACVLTAALLIEPLATPRQVAIWHDASTLWRATVAARPRSVRARYNLAGVLAEQGHRTRAHAQLRRVLAVDPGYAPAYLGLAWLACRSGYRRKAEEHLAHAIALGADATRTQAVRAGCSERTGGSPPTG